jgi:hypothetical protein
MKAFIYGFLPVLSIAFTALTYGAQQTQFIPGNQQGQKSQPGQVQTSNQHSDVLEVQYSEEGISASEGATVEVIVVVEETSEEEK